MGMSNDEARKQALWDAADAIEIARVEPGPVTFITGNSHMPPLRAFGHAEDVWQAVFEHDATDQQWEAWETYAETFERTLEDASVYLACPDYDNALYVVDLARWQYRDEADDAETLTDEWEPVTDDASERTYTLAEIRDGTGWPAGVRFRIVGDDDA